MFGFINTKIFNFAKFAARSQGLGLVQPVVKQTMNTADLYGRFRRKR